MPNTKLFSLSTLPRDATSSVVVFLVALPLCLGIALASNAPLISGLLAGIIGGIVVGSISRSHSSVSGPAAGLATIVAAQIASLRSFETFLLAVVFAGMLQIMLGVAHAGFIAAFFPSSVIKGLLAAIGVILVLKQIPHVLGHDLDPEGEMSFTQPDHENTLSELVTMMTDLHPGAAAIGLISITTLYLWERFPKLKKSIIPSPLIVVIFGVGANWLFQRIGGRWAIEPSHLVQVPVSETLSDFVGFLKSPDFSRWHDPAVCSAAVTIAMVASLETLLNLQAIDKLDPLQRSSPPNRELIAQGVGNVVAGLVGGIPVTSVIVRGSVHLNAGGRTKLATIFHGMLLLVSVAFLPRYLNRIPLSCLAAILLVTGIKLASPSLVKQMWREGRYQFMPFALTVVAIILTDLVIGVLIGLAISIGFILNSNLRRPLRRIVEKYLSGEVLHIELANQVSFLNRAALNRALNQVQRGGHVLLDAHDTVYIDPDILSLIREFKEKIAPAREVQVSLRGFRDKYHLADEIQYVDYSTRELQAQLAPEQVLQILKEGNERFRTECRLTRDLTRQVHATADGQHPIAVILSCIDSRAPAEMIFDLGLGDILNVRVAGNVLSREVLGSIEYGTVVAGAKLVVVMGHTQCGAVTAAVNLSISESSAEQTTGCQHLEPIVGEICESIDLNRYRDSSELSPGERGRFVNDVSRLNVLRTVGLILTQSRAISDLTNQGRIAVVGAMYDVATGEIDFTYGEQRGDIPVGDQLHQSPRDSRAVP